MTTFEAYKTYLALRLHFTTNYNITKTKGHVKASTATLDKNVKLQWELQRLKRKYRQRDFIGYLVANFVSGDKWGGVYNAHDAENIYLKWQAIQDGLTYKYKQDLEKFVIEGVTEVKQLWDCSSGHPIILKRYLGKTCNIETLVILQKLYKYAEPLDVQLVLDPVWESVSKLIHNYSPFVKIDKPSFLKITEEILNQ